MSYDTFLPSLAHCSRIWGDLNLAFYGSLDWTFNGLNDMGMEFNMELEGKVGSAFGFEHNFELSPKYEPFPKSGQTTRIAEFEIGGRMMKDWSFVQNSSSICLANIIGFHHTWTIKMSVGVSGSLKTSGISFYQIKMILPTEVNDTLNFGDLSELSQGLKMLWYSHWKSFFKAEFGFGKMKEG
jgi:hypothetical protein